MNRKDSKSRQGKTVRINGLEINYWERGSGQPLILLHGALDTHQLWDPFIPVFARDFRVITPDGRGHGGTINPSSQITYQMMADDLAGLIRSLQLPRPFIFGYSDGGQAVLDLGIRYPDLAGALVIGGVWYRMAESYQDAICKAGFTGPGEVDLEAFGRQAPIDWQARMQQAHLDPREEYPRILLSQLSRLWWTPLNYSKREIKSISVPTLILMAEKDEMIPLEQAKELAELIPEAELAVIPGVGHTDLLVKGGQFQNILLDFLGRVLRDLNL